MAESAFNAPQRAPQALRRTPLGRHVREVLGHLHEPAYLEVHPLAAALHAAGLASGNHPLRAALTRLIERLAPGDTAGPRGDRPHLVLHLRYVEGLAIAEVCAQLAISESEYYRSHRQGLDALVSLVSNLGGHASPPTADCATAAADLLPHQAPLVGRTEEYNHLLRGFAEVAAGGGGALTFVVGPAGVGKSRLVAEVGAQVQQSGGLFLRGACPREGLQPHDPWLEPLQQALASLSPRELTSAVGPYAAHLARLLPDLRERLPLPEGVPPETRGDRRWLFDGVVRVLTHLGQHTPVLLQLDDLQWAASLALLQHVAQHLQHCRVLVVAAYRDDELGDRPQLAQALPDLHRAGWHHQLRLGPLPAAGTQALLAAYLGHALAARLTPEVHAKTGGNPFYVEELLWSLADSGALQWRADAWELTAGCPVALPSAVTALLLERVTRLGPRTTDVLTQAAVLGDAFPFGDLQALTGLAEGDVVAALERALGARLLVDRSTDDDERYAFADPAVQAALLAGISSPRRRRLSLRAAGLRGTRSAGEGTAAAAHLAGAC